MAASHDNQEKGEHDPPETWKKEVDNHHDVSSRCVGSENDEPGPRLVKTPGPYVPAMFLVLSRRI